MKYRFGFALTMALGNKTRYLNLKKYADRDPEVECVWAPISHYLDPDPYRRFPERLRKQLILRREAAPILESWRSLDAVMVHAFQLFVSLSFKPSIGTRPLLVWSQDYVPIADFDTLKNYGQSARDIRLRLLRYRFDVWLTRRADYYIPFSDAVGDALLRECAVSAEKVRVINVGVDLELWPHVEPPPGDQSRPELLFVGGDFIRKGGDLLLDVVREHFADRVTLHLVTQQAPAQLPDYVRVHSGLGPNDPRLRELYGNCTALVLPTTADMAPQVVMEAMATGRPVISTRVGAIPEMVSDGQTGFLIEPNDGRALKTAIDRVLADRALARGMGQKGRAFVEEHFNAALSTSRILAAMKELTDRRRFRAARSKSQRTFASA